MIRIRQIKVNIELDNIDELKRQISKKLRINMSDILSVKIEKKSIDARDKNNIYFVYEVDVLVNGENIILRKVKSNDVFISPKEVFQFNITGENKMKLRPVIVGSGPAGLFCAYMLAMYGYKPLIIERGEIVDERIKTVEKFWKTGILNNNSNVQFGEGGAGTFSDGKLNTLVKDKNFCMKKVFEIFVEHGANENILYESKPHIGTDVLRGVVASIRNKIIDMGGEFRFNTCLTDINIKDNKLESIIVNNNEEILCDNLILAIGHSARDTFYMLEKNNIYMESKPFAVGIRVMHPQDMINKSQYGKFASYLKPASYKLTYTTENNRGVYSFCMCPGGYVVNASSEQGLIAINGMSNNARDTLNANSAIVVTVSLSDYGNSVLDGIEFQRSLERKAYEIGNGKIPVQLLGDYYENKKSSSFKDVEPIFKGNYEFANINEIFPEYINESIKEAFNYFGKKIKGFDRVDAIIAGVESRTSSPIRIKRDENFMSNVKGIYPCGEGAGYAGGITTSAMDGIKVAQAIANLYCK